MEVEGVGVFFSRVFFFGLEASSSSNSSPSSSSPFFETGRFLFTPVLLVVLPAGPPVSSGTLINVGSQRWMNSIKVFDTLVFIRISKCFSRTSSRSCPIPADSWANEA